MSASANPLLYQVLRRRRLRQRARLAAAVWVFFGGLHILVWWAAFNSGGSFGPDGTIWKTDILRFAVWPLLLAASVSFVVMMVYALRWFYEPRATQEFDWLERPGDNTSTATPGQSEECTDDPSPSAASAG